MTNYRVSFFKVEKEQNEKGKTQKVGEDYIGTIVIDDTGTGPDLTLISKAFRHAPSNYLFADKVVVERI